MAPSVPRRFPGVGNNVTVSWFRRRKRPGAQPREADELRKVLYEHLVQFVRTRRGVEAWVERPTSFNKPSILLVAADGESTRRAMPSEEYGYAFAEEQHIPCYDAGVVPYPQRMREYGKVNKRRPIA
jgi:hypothetical protein